MRRLVKWISLGTLALAACGVPEEKYKAAVSESARAMKSADEQRERAEAAEKKVAELSARAGGADQRVQELTARLAEQEQAVKAASDDAAKQRELATQLARTRELLEAEKAAASAEAERQRQLAVRLEEERSALQQKSTEYQALASSLGKEIKEGRVQISELQGKVTVRMAERVLFPSGSATISAEGKGALRKVAAAFKGVAGRIIRVEGHTDNVPIRTERFPSNWELSAARAIAVVRVLQAEGIDPALLGAAGYAEYQPMAPNDTAEGRAQNRRIEITLAAPLPAAGAGK
jgi:chemotaxis protein MotB